MGMCIINIHSNILVMPSTTIFYQVDKMIMGALASKRLRTTALNTLRSSPEYSGHINADVEVITMVLQNQAKSNESLVGQEGRPRLRLVSYISQSCSDLERVKRSRLCATVCVFGN